jgi:hypothetical protein
MTVSMMAALGKRHQVGKMLFLGLGLGTSLIVDGKAYGAVTFLLSFALRD